jgi:hypothetical protein
MNNEKMRAEFEAICKSLGYHGMSFACWGEHQGCAGCDDYSDDQVAALYSFFKASRAALRVVLPERFKDVPSWDCYEGGFNGALGEAVDAIESTGVSGK